MIKQFIINLGFCLCILPSMVWAQGFSTESPVEYNNYIVAEQSQLMQKVVEYIVQTVHNNNFREVESKRLEVIGQIETSMNKLEQMSDFKGDNSMKKEALSVFKLYREAYINDYSQINMLKQDRESSFEAMERYFQAQDQAEEKLRTSADRFTAAQQAFADKHQMTITAAESDGTISNIAEVNKYSRMVFLEFFKISKLNGKALDALNTQEPEKIEQARLLLLEGAEKAYLNLKEIEPYNGDDEYRSRTLAYVAYHRLFAKKELVELREILAKEDRSNEDIDRYNEIIQTYNTDIQVLINNFNNANVNLLRRHIPNTSISFKDEGQKG